ncbi:MAG: hypothetical protein AAGG50_06535 [Bacteroidota bacterium]
MDETEVRAVEYKPTVMVLKAGTFAELVELVRERPGMFVGKKSLYGLACFVGGARHVESAHSTEPEAWKFNRPDQFERWVELRGKPQPISSFDFALAQADSDDAAFDLWFAWWDEFQRERNGKAATESSPPGQEGVGVVDRPSNELPMS